MIESAIFAVESVFITALSALIIIFITIGNLVQARRVTEQAETAEQCLAVAWRSFLG
jgi:hypothetical protein